MLFEAQQLCCQRGDRLLFDSLSFSLDAGQAILVTGANGSGKTSLLKILAGLAQAESGQCCWQGKPIQKNRQAFYQDTLYIGHQNGIKLSLTASENLNFYTQFTNIQSKIPLEHALDEIGLGGFEHEQAQTLSAGQRRRIALARLLVSQAKLWIMDELFTSIDQKTILTLVELIKRHLDSGGMTIMTSHHSINLDGYDVQALELTA